MKSPYIWITIALLAIIIAGIIFWPKDRSPEIEQLQQNITREYTIKRDLQEKLSQTLARIRTDSLQQAKEREGYLKRVGELKRKITQLSDRFKDVSSDEIDSLLIDLYGPFAVDKSGSDK